MWVKDKGSRKVQVSFAEAGSERVWLTNCARSQKMGCVHFIMNMCAAAVRDAEVTDVPVTPPWKAPHAPHTAHILSRLETPLSKRA